MTPCHYDKSDNFLMQVLGTKRVLLFPPDESFRLYPYPVGHPLDTFAMVDVEHPNMERFPLCTGLRGREVLLRPGDILHIPRFWWHHVGQGQGDNISVNFWCAPGPAQPCMTVSADQDGWPACLFIGLPIRCRPLVAQRTLEAMALQASRLPTDWNSGRLLTELARAGRPEEHGGILAEGAAPLEVQGTARYIFRALAVALGQTVGGTLGELDEEAAWFAGASDARAVLEGMVANGRLHPGPPPPESSVVIAAAGEVGGWLRSPFNSA